MSRRDLLTQREVAEYLGVTTRTVRNWSAAGKLPAYKLGDKIVRYDMAEVDAFLSLSRVGPKL